MSTKTKKSKSQSISKKSKSQKNNVNTININIKLNSGVTPDGIKWKKTGSTGDEALDVYLDNGQTIISDKHALNFMDGGIKFETKMGKITKAFGRMFSGETALLNYLTGTDSNKLQKVNLGMSISGDVVYLPIPFGKKWRVSKGAFLAGTQNTVISSSTKIGLGGFFSGEGFVLSELGSSEGDAGAWITSFGHIEKHILQNNEVLYINNNLFLAADNNISYVMKRIGGFKSIITGGEGLVMKFTGPCEIYTQSKDITGLIYKLKSLIKYKK